MASFAVFQVLGFSSNWFFTLVAFDKNGNADWSEIFWPGENKLHHRLSIVRDRSFLVVLILDRAWPLWSGCDMTCFCYMTGTTTIYSVHEHGFQSPWL